MATNLKKLQEDLDKPSVMLDAGKLINEVVSKRQLLTVLQAVMKKLQEGEQRLNQTVNESNTKLDRQFREAETKISEMFADTKADVTAFRQQTEKQINNAMSAFQQRVDMLIDTIPEGFDDTELRQMIDAVQSEIPEAFDPKDILNTLEEQQRQIDALKKRPVGSGGGGVTDMRIRQAAKYIVKTEAPVGDIDGANTDYTVSQDIFAVLSFSLNGEVIAQIPNYTIAGKTITFSSALPAAYSGKDFEIVYI